MCVPVCAAAGEEDQGDDLAASGALGAMLAANAPIDALLYADNELHCPGRKAMQLHFLAQKVRVLGVGGGKSHVCRLPHVGACRGVFGGSVGAATNRRRQEACLGDCGHDHVVWRARFGLSCACWFLAHVSCSHYLMGHMAFLGGGRGGCLTLCMGCEC